MRASEASWDIYQHLQLASLGTQICDAEPAVSASARHRRLGVLKMAQVRDNLGRLESRRSVDLLPDREVSTLTTWLTQHTGIEIISRDQTDCYSKASSAGAPQAAQVAARWHLLKNMGRALQRLVNNFNVSSELIELIMNDL